MSDETIDDELDTTGTDTGGEAAQLPAEKKPDLDKVKAVDEISHGEWQGMSEDEKSAAAKKTEEKAKAGAKPRAKKLEPPAKKPGAEGDQTATGGDDAAAKAKAAAEGKKPEEENTAYFRMRKAEKEAAELKKKQADDMAAKEEKRKAAEAAAKGDAEPNKADNPEAWYEWKTRKLEKENEELRTKFSKHDEFIGKIERDELKNGAIKELVAIEKDYAKKVPDYEEAVGHMARCMLQAKRWLEPGKTVDEVKEEVSEIGLKIAAEAYNSGKDPAEVLYKMAVDTYGWKGKAPDDDDDDDDAGDDDGDPSESKNPAAKIKPGANLKNLAEAKKRSASGLSAGGRGTGGQLTAESALDMTNAEFAALPKKEKDRLMGGRN